MEDLQDLRLNKKDIKTKLVVGFGIWHSSVLPAVFCSPSQMIGYYLWSHNQENFGPPKTFSIFRNWSNEQLTFDSGVSLST